MTPNSQSFGSGILGFPKPFRTQSFFGGTGAICELAELDTLLGFFTAFSPNNFSFFQRRKRFATFGGRTRIQIPRMPFDLNTTKLANVKWLKGFHTSFDVMSTPVGSLNRKVMGARPLSLRERFPKVLPTNLQGITTSVQTFRSVRSRIFALPSVIVSANAMFSTQMLPFNTSLFIFRASSDFETTSTTPPDLRDGGGRSRGRRENGKIQGELNTRARNVMDGERDFLQFDHPFHTFFSEPSHP